MLELIAGAGVAGLIGSIHCIGMCGSFAVACGGTARESIFWHAGRLTTYMVLGALAGAFGGSIPGPGWIAGVISTLLIVYFAAVLAGLLPEPQVSIPGVQRAASKLISRPEAGARYLFGLVNGLLPCGLVYATLAVPVALGDPATGAAAMLLFGLGTVPAPAPAAGGGCTRGRSVVDRHAPGSARVGAWYAARDGGGRHSCYGAHTARGAAGLRVRRRLAASLFRAPGPMYESLGAGRSLRPPARSLLSA
jgi:hypothetical protein